VTVRLAVLAVDEWASLDGLTAAAGLKDLRTLPLDRFCNLVYWYATRNADHTGIEKFRARLWQPPKALRGQPIPKQSPWSAENEASAFAALKAGLGGKG
jgi:hypothetical protein